MSLRGFFFIKRNTNDNIVINIVCEREGKTERGGKRRRREGKVRNERRGEREG